MLEVGYWDIRGLGAPLRMMCEYAGVEYKPVNYTVSPKEGGGWDTSDWFNKKPALKEKNALMNLPYIVDGDTVVTQSNACLTYLGRKFKLNGETEHEQTKMEQCLCEIFDLRNNIVRMAYGSADQFTTENVKIFFSTCVGTSYGKLEAWLNQHGTVFLASDKPTTADFHLFELIDQMEILARKQNLPSPMTDFPKLQEFYKKFAAIPAIAKYLESDLAKLPMNNKMATFK